MRHPLEIFSDRRVRLATVVTAKVDAAIISSPLTMHWLGLKPRGRLVVAKDGNTEIVDVAEFLGWLNARPNRRVAVDDRLTVASALALGLPMDRLVDGRTMFSRVNERKDELELALLRRAGAITTQALDSLWEQVEPGMSRVAAKGRLEQTIIGSGADGFAFDPSIAIAEMTQQPWSGVGPELMSSGDLLCVDVGAAFKGYLADVSRSMVVAGVGSANRAVERDLQALGELHSELSELIRPGMAMADFCRTAGRAASRLRIDLSDQSALGHGVGITLHEHPFIDEASDDIFEESTVICLEPAARVDGGTARIERMYEVTATAARLIAS